MIIALSKFRELYHAICYVAVKGEAVSVEGYASTAAGALRALADSMELTERESGEINYEGRITQFDA